MEREDVRRSDDRLHLMIRSKEELLALRPLRQGVVEFNGSEIPVREMTAAERDQISKMVSSEERNIWEVNAHIAVMGCEFLSADDVPDLMAHSSDLIAAISEKVTELSGMNEEAVDDAKKS